MKVTAERFAIEGPAGQLQAMLESTTESGSDWAAVICHPHPQFQGTMLNKVVHTLSRSCTDIGIPALRFNYRGVGQSDGVYDDGRGETDDARAAVDWLQMRYPQANIVLAGFSFGAGVVLRLASEIEPHLLVSVAPPIGRTGVPAEISLTNPWLVVQGGADELVDSQEVEDWAERQQPPPQVVFMDGVSHFFHGNLSRLRNHVSAFVAHHTGRMLPAQAQTTPSP